MLVSFRVQINEKKKEEKRRWDFSLQDKCGYLYDCRESQNRQRKNIIEKKPGDNNEESTWIWGFSQCVRARVGPPPRPRWLTEQGKFCWSPEKPLIGISSTLPLLWLANASPYRIVCHAFSCLRCYKGAPPWALLSQQRWPLSLFFIFYF